MILYKWRNMENYIGLLFSLIISIVIMLIIMTGSFLIMLFSSGDDGMRYCFFKTLYFDSVTHLDGSVKMSFGFTGEYLPGLIFTACLLTFIYSSFCMVKSLLNYRENLIEQRKK